MQYETGVGWPHKVRMLLHPRRKIPGRRSRTNRTHVVRILHRNTRHRLQLLRSHRFVQDTAVQIVPDLGKHTVLRCSTNVQEVFYTASPLDVSNVQEYSRVFAGLVSNAVSNPPLHRNKIF